MTDFLDQIDGAFSDLLNAIDEATGEINPESKTYAKKVAYLERLEKQVEDLCRGFQHETAEHEEE